MIRTSDPGGHRVGGRGPLATAIYTSMDLIRYGPGPPQYHPQQSATLTDPRRERRVQTLLFPEFRIPVPTDHHTVHTNNHNHISYYGRYILESYVRRKILSAVTQLTSNSILTELVGAVGCGGWSSCLASWVSCKIRVDRESSRFRSVCLCAAALPPVSCE